MQYIPTTSLPCPVSFERGVGTRCSAFGGGCNSWHFCRPVVRFSHILFLEKSKPVLCYLLESCSTPVLEHGALVCKNSDHCYWCHVAGGGHCNSFNGCPGSENLKLFWRIVKIGNTFHNQVFISASFSTVWSNFYHLVGCSRFLVHTNPLSSQQCIEVRNSAPLQSSRKHRDTVHLGGGSREMGWPWQKTPNKQTNTHQVWE